MRSSSGAVARAAAYWDGGGQTPGGQTGWKRDRAAHLLPAGVPVLDIGCGRGDSSVPGAVGVDADGRVLAEAATRGVLAVLADIESPWPFPDARAGGVVLFDVLEHVPDPRFLLAEAARVLRHDGTLLVTLPNAAHLANRVAAVAGRTTDFTDASHRSGQTVSDHLHRFTAATGARLLAESGFAVVERLHWFPEAFSEGGWHLLSPVAHLLSASGVVGRLPSLLAYEFLFVCRKGGSGPTRGAP